MELSGPADFGVTVADGKVLTREVFVVNEGSLTGEFKIKYNGNQPITIMPSGGIIKPGARQSIKVSFISIIDILKTLQTPVESALSSTFSVPKLKHKHCANHSVHIWSDSTLFIHFLKLKQIQRVI